MDISQATLNKAYLIFGGNMGETSQFFELALTELSNSGIDILRKSALYNSEAWGYDSSHQYLNQAIEINTTLTAMGLLDTCLSIELKLGRIRDQINKYEDRNIDIDILFYNREIIETAHLIIPHPRITERRFVLEPLNELDSQLIHPIFDKTIHELLIACQDKCKVSRVENK